MGEKHQLAPNSARQFRTAEHYKFENACQLPSSSRAKKRPVFLLMHRLRVRFTSENRPGSTAALATGQRWRGSGLFRLG